MGNLTLYKILFKKTYPLDTQYSNLEDIPLIDINKEDYFINKSNYENYLIINTASNNQLFSKELEKINNFANNNRKTLILLFPSNSFYNEPLNYKQIKEIYNYDSLPKNIKLMSKIEVEGPFTHPIYKYIFRKLNNEVDVPFYLKEKDFCKFYFSKSELITTKNNYNYII